jgi:hypothetical protein
VETVCLQNNYFVFHAYIGLKHHFIFLLVMIPKGKIGVKMFASPNPTVKL